MEYFNFEYKGFTIQATIENGELICLNEFDFFFNKLGLELRQTPEIVEVFKKSYMEMK